MAEQLTTSHTPTTTSQTIRAHAALLRRYAWFIALVVCVALLATFLLTQRQDRTYAASSRVLLRTNATFSLFPFSTTGPIELFRVPETEALYTQSSAFIALARKNSPLRVSVAANASGDSLTFTARGAVPEDVAAAATAWAETYVEERQSTFEVETRSGIDFLESSLKELGTEREEIREQVAEFEELLATTTDPDQFSRILSQKVSIETLLQPQLAPIDRQIAEFGRQLADLELVTLFLDTDDVSARVLALPGVPKDPVSPNVRRNLVLGGLLGLVFGIVPPYVRQAFDDKIGARVDIREATGLPVLASIPSFAHDADLTIEVLDHPTGIASERYQSLLTAIEFASIGDPISSVLFTSSSPGDGKTTTAVNIAALASRYMNVLLIDADMRRPNLHELLNVANGVGLSDVLFGTAEYFDARQVFERDGCRFDVLSAGPIIKDPALLLRGDAWPQLMSELYLYDLVIVDGPPVLAVTDALLIGREVDAQILLSRAGATTRAGIAEATELIASNGSRALGVVINRQKSAKHRYTYYDYQSTD